MHQPASHGEILELWKVHAEAVMPSLSSPHLAIPSDSNYSTQRIGTTKPSVFDFKRDDKGFPILVGLDLANTTSSQASDVLNAYLAETWSECLSISMEMLSLIYPKQRPNTPPLAITLTSLGRTSR